MLLAEALIEKEYIEESIDGVNEYIYNLLETDKAKPQREIIEKKIKELNNLYREYQRFDISIGRSESRAMIKINDTELSLRDCRIMEDAMYEKLSDFEDILKNSQNNGMGDILCDAIVDAVGEIRLDIKTIDTKIQSALWNTEVN